MKLGGQLVGVSTYDRGRPGVGDRPVVGDYQAVDWEQLASLRPTCMIVQIAADRLPTGFKEKADALHIQLIDVAIDRIADIFNAMHTLGVAANAEPTAAAATMSLRGRLDQIRAQAMNHPPVSTLMVLNEAGTAAVGPGSFLDESLILAGGRNAAAGLNNAWPTIDDETLNTLKPDVVIVLLPEASPQSIAQAKANWARRTNVPAVVGGRVQVITAWYALLPGWHVADLAESIAQCLEPLPSTSPLPPGVRAPAGAAHD